MADDPYTPPGSDLAERPPPRGRGSRARAVAFGCLADIVGTALFGIVSSFAFGIALVAGGVQPEEIPAVLAASPGYQIFSFAGGLCFTVLGGFIAARVANYLEYRTALWVGVIGLVIGELSLALSPGAVYPAWSRLLGDLLIVPAALFGANLKVKRFGKGAR